MADLVIVAASFSVGFVFGYLTGSLRARGPR